MSTTENPGLDTVGTRRLPRHPRTFVQSGMLGFRSFPHHACLTGARDCTVKHGTALVSGRFPRLEAKNRGVQRGRAGIGFSAGEDTFGTRREPVTGTRRAA